MQKTDIYPFNMGGGGRGKCREQILTPLVSLCSVHVISCCPPHQGSQCGFTELQHGFTVWCLLVFSYGGKGGGCRELILTPLISLCSVHVISCLPSSSGLSLKMYRVVSTGAWLWDSAPTKNNSSTITRATTS